MADACRPPPPPPSVPSRALAQAAASVMSLSYEVTSGKELTAAKTKVEGVGKSTAAKIDEILASGTFQKLEDLRIKAQNM